MVSYDKFKSLTDKQKEEIKCLVDEVHKFDNTKKDPYLSNQFNYYPDMPAFIVARENEKMIGFLMLYADGEPNESVDVFLIVSPKMRKQGIGTKLWQIGRVILREYGYSQWEFISEGGFLDANPLFLNKLCLLADPEPEYQMRLSQKSQRLEKIQKDLKIRPLEKNDILAIVPIYIEAFPDSSAKEAQTYLTMGLADKNNRNFVLLFKDSAVGCCSIDISSKEEYYLYGLFIAKNFRNKGFARTFITEIVEYFEESNESQKTFVLAVDGSNTAAFHLYKKLGFEIESKVYYLSEVN